MVGEDTLSIMGGSIPVRKVGDAYQFDYGGITYSLTSVGRVPNRQRRIAERLYGRMIEATGLDFETRKADLATIKTWVDTAYPLSDPDEAEPELIPISQVDGLQDALDSKADL